MASKKIVNEIEKGTGLTVNYGGGEYTATACRVEPNWTEDGITDGGYTIGYQKEMMPTFNSDDFDTLDELEAAMRSLEPDLRKWRNVESDY